LLLSAKECGSIQSTAIPSADTACNVSSSIFISEHVS
jgi:hypothetical protein